VDNARTAVVCLVVNMHCCVTYSHVGGWYLTDGPEGTLAEKFPYILWIFHLQAFFMGLMFFLAGAFAEGAIQRHGAAAFLRERFVRLGLPALVYMSVVQPFIVYGLLAAESESAERFGAAQYLDYLFSVGFVGGSGPMWFALALLFFSAILGAWRLAKSRRASCLGVPIRPVPSPAARQGRERLGGGASIPGRLPVPGIGALFAVAASLAVATTLTRAFFPIGSSFFNFQLCYFPQYIAAFAFGLAAARGDWLTALAASPRAKHAGLLALVGGPLLLTLLVHLGGAPEESGAPGEHGPILYFGGWSAQAFGAAAWEQFTGLGLALGLMA
jgi:hypothetical protein